MGILTAILLFVGGLFLIGMDFFVPSGAVLGVSGGICILASIYSAHIAWGLWGAVAFTGGALMAVPVVVWVGLKRLTLNKSLDAKKGFVGVADLSGLVGKEGSAMSDLRPSGAVLIGQNRVDVVSEYGMIRQGAKVKVLRTEGNRVVVGEIK